MAFVSCFGPFCSACGWALRVERCDCGGGPVCAFDALRACNGGGVASIGDLFVAVGYATPRLPSVSAVKWLAAMITRACPCGVVVIHLDHDVCCRFLPRGRIVRISLLEALEFSEAAYLRRLRNSSHGGTNASRRSEPRVAAARRE